MMSIPASQDEASPQPCAVEQRLALVREFLNGGHAHGAGVPLDREKRAKHTEGEADVLRRSLYFITTGRVRLGGPGPARASR